MLAQIRSGTLPLKIETGRFTRVELENRLCIYCNQEKIESEIHFILECDCYVRQRETLFEINNINCHNLDDNAKVKMLFDLFPRQLAKFCIQCFDIRQELSYCMK